MLLCVSNILLDDSRRLGEGDSESLVEVVESGCGGRDLILLQQMLFAFAQGQVRPSLQGVRIKKEFFEQCRTEYFSWPAVEGLHVDQAIPSALEAVDDCPDSVVM